MTDSENLSAFVRDALGKGVSRAEIKGTLLRAGWSPKQVNDALAGFSDIPFPIPVPKPQSYTSARDSFLYSLLFVSLTLSAYNFGWLIFAFIDYFFPLQDGVESLREATRWPISMLVAALPVFFYITLLLNREMRQDPGKRSSKSRIQMIYIILFVCAAVVIIVFSGLVYNFLGNEITKRFLLKCLTVVGIAGAIFAYYLRSIRAEPAEIANNGSGAKLADTK